MTYFMHALSGYVQTEQEWHDDYYGDSFAKGLTFEQWAGECLVEVVVGEDGEWKDA